MYDADAADYLLEPPEPVTWQGQWLQERGYVPDEETVLQEFYRTLEEADSKEWYTNTCSRCKKKIVYVPYAYALGEGHVYSTAGRAEVQISHFCEYCFDLVTKEPEEDFSAEENVVDNT